LARACVAALASLIAVLLAGCSDPNEAWMFGPPGTNIQADKYRCMKENTSRQADDTGATSNELDYRMFKACMQALGYRFGPAPAGKG
jgi:hypothetical protein